MYGKLPRNQGSFQPTPPAHCRQELNNHAQTCKHLFQNFSCIELVPEVNHVRLMHKSGEWRHVGELGMHLGQAQLQRLPSEARHVAHPWPHQSA